jgi:hypothetical protein
VEENLRKVFASHQRDWDERLPLFLLAYRASTHDTTGLTPARLVFGLELRLPCDLLFGAPPDKERPTTDHTAELVDHLLDIHDYVRRHLKLDSDRMKTRHDKLAHCAGYHEGTGCGSIAQPAGKRNHSNFDHHGMAHTNNHPKNDVVYRIQKPVSFDVVNLFTNVPVYEALQVIRNRLDNDNILAELSVMELLDVCLRATYFQGDNGF